MKRFDLAFSMLDENKCLLGIDYMKGYMVTENDKRERYHDIYIGLIFFFITLSFRKSDK